MVQDVSADKSGFLRTVFDFGDVIIQTAGENPNFTFEGVPHPEQVVDQIQRSVAGREDREHQSTDQTAEAMQEAAETMKEAAETMKEPAENIKQAADEVSNGQASSAPQDPAPTAQAEPTPSQPAAEAPAPDQPDDYQDLPRDYEK
jgi:methyl-accepting chemotaxis protein